MKRLPRLPKREDFGEQRNVTLKWKRFAVGTNLEKTSHPARLCGCAARISLHYQLYRVAHKWYQSLSNGRKGNLRSYHLSFIIIAFGHKVQLYL